MRAFILLILALMGLQTTQLNAADRTWTGGAAGNWFDAGNWEDGNIPDAEDDVAIFDFTTAGGSIAVTIDNGATGNTSINRIVAQNPGSAVDTLTLTEGTNFLTFFGPGSEGAPNVAGQVIFNFPVNSIRTNPGDTFFFSPGNAFIGSEDIIFSGQGIDMAENTFLTFVGADEPNNLPILRLTQSTLQTTTIQENARLILSGDTTFVDSISIGTNSSVEWNVAGNGVFNGSVSGGGGITSARNSTLTFLDTVTNQDFLGIQENAQVIFNSNTDFVLPGELSSNGVDPDQGIQKLNVNTIRFTNTANNFDGSIDLDAGTLIFEAGTLPQNATNIVDVANGATVQFDYASNQTQSAQITGAGSIVKSGAGSLELTNTNNNYTGTFTIQNGTVIGTTTTLPTAITLDQEEGGDATFQLNVTGNVDYGFAIDGTGNFAKGGAGTFTPTIISDFTGRVSVLAGTFNTANPAPMGGMTELQVNDGATFNAEANTGIDTLVHNDGGADGIIALGGNTFTVGASDAAFDGVISGAGGSLIKNTNGTLTLTGTNTFDGGVTIEQGTLVARVASVDMDIVFNVTDPNTGTLRFTTAFAADDTYGNIISGNGDVEFQPGNGGVITLIGVNTYTGTTKSLFNPLNLDTENCIANSSALSIATDASVALGADQTFNALARSDDVTDGFIQLNSSDLSVKEGSYNGSILNNLGQATNFRKIANDDPDGGTLTLSGATFGLDENFAFVVEGGTLVLSGGTTPGSVQVNNGATFQIGADTTIATLVNAGGGGNGTFNIGDNTLTLGATNGTFNGVISGTNGSFTKNTANTVTLAGVNTYTGATLVQAGTLTITTGGSIAASSRLTLDEGTTFTLENQDMTLNELGESAGDAEGSIVLTGSTLTVDSFEGTSYRGVISGTGGVIFGDSVQLTQNCTYSGATTLAQGTLTLGAASGISNSSSVTFNSGTQLTLNSDQTLKSLTDGTGVGTKGTIQTNGNVLTVNATPATFTGIITGSGEVHFRNAVTLGAANDYTGATVVETGNLKLETAGTIEDTPTLMLKEGSSFTLQTDKTIQQLTHDTDPGATDGTIFLGANQLTFNGTNSTSFNGQITGNAGSLRKVGAESATLTGANDFTGNIIIEDGVLEGNTTSLTTDITFEGAAENKNITFNQTADGTFSNQITGDGTFTKLGAANLTLDAAQAYTGQTQVAAGTLTLGANGSLTNSTVTISENATLAILADKTLTSIIAAGANIDGDIELGANTLTVGSTPAGSISSTITGVGGSLTTTGNFGFEGIAEFTGNANIESGIFTLGVGAQFTEPTVNLSTGAQLTLEGSKTLKIASNTNVGTINLGANTLTISNDVAGDNNLIISGAGNLILEGDLTMNNTQEYEGSTTVREKTLTLTNSASIASSSELLLTENAILAIEADQTLQALRHNPAGTDGNVSIGSNTLTLGATSGEFFNGVISGTNGNLSTTGAVNLEGAHTFTGTTTVASGTLTLTTNGTLAGSVSVAEEGTLKIAANKTFSELVFAQTGNGTLDLQGNTLTLSSGGFNGTLTSTGAAGTLLLDTPQTTFELGGVLGNTLTTTVVRQGNAELKSGANVAGNIQIEPNGVVTLAGNASINQIQVDEEANSDGSISLGTSTLSLAQTSASFRGAITGTGGLTKTGTTTATFSGTHSYSGTTSVNAGTFVMNGTSTQSTFELNGGDLKGTGSLLNVTNISGNVAPGNSIGTLNITGNYTQQANGNLTIELTPTQSDKLAITGAASLNGSLTVQPAAGVYPLGTTYTILTASSVTGQFSRVLESHELAFNPSYSTTAVTLVVGAPTVVTPIPNNELPSNAREVADNLFSDPEQIVANADLDFVVDQLVNLSISDYEEALVRLSPLCMAAMPLVNFQKDVQMAVVLDKPFQKHFQDRYTKHKKANQLSKKQKKRGEREKKWGIRSPDIAKPQSGLFFEPVGLYYNQRSTQGSLLEDGQVPFRAYTYGFGTGWEQVLKEQWILEGGVGYTHSNLVWSKHFGNSKWSTLYVAPFVGWFNHLGYANVMAMGAFNFYTIDRRIYYPGMNRVATSHPKSYDLGVRVNGGGQVHLGHNVFLQPDATLNFLTLFNTEYAEKGAQSLNLTLAKRTNYFLQPSLRMKVIKEWYTSKWTFAPNVTVGWLANILLNSDQIASRFSILTNTPFFDIQGYYKSYSQLIAGAEWWMRNTSCGLELKATFEADVLSKFEVLTFKVRLQYPF